MSEKVIPRRMMTKVRKKFHRPTRAETPKNVYDRNEAKRELQEIIEEEFECTCERMVCRCGDYDDEHVAVSTEGEEDRSIS